MLRSSDGLPSPVLHLRDCSSRFDSDPSGIGGSAGVSNLKHQLLPLTLSKVIASLAAQMELVKTGMYKYTSEAYSVHTDQSHRTLITF